MNLKSILNELNISAQCKRSGVPLLQCPQFLFLIMGVVIIGSSVAAYMLGMYYAQDPQLVVLVVIAAVAILFVISFIIIQSFERVAEASRMKSEFINVVSHQLRSPLANLGWSIDFLMTAQPEEAKKKQAEYLQILKENIARMNSMVNDLLVISRLETGKLPLRTQDFSLVDLVSNLVSEFRPFAESSNVEITIDSDDGLPLLFADPSQIRLVVENLLDNAIRYTKKQGKIEIKINKTKDGAYFEIQDRGVGIPKEDQKFIFQKFFRSENALRHQTQGSGLGLYIAKSIIEKSKGKMGFQSEENQGSIFWFTLPVKY